MNSKKLWIAFSLFVVTAFSQTSFAQGLNWEGQTGALLTPFAYTAGSPAGKFGKPEVAFPYLNAGNVIGNEYQFSVTEGFGKRFEAGFTEAFSSAGNTAVVSNLFTGGYTVLHGKFTVVPENSYKTKWVPAIAVGAVGRLGDERVYWDATESGPSTPKGTSADFYIVATKTVTQVKGFPFVLSLGDKLTNASIMGIAGQAGTLNTLDQRWQGRLFGAAAFVVKGPAKSALIFGAEAVQQPHYVQGLNFVLRNLTENSGVTATIPTSLSYFVRVVPHLEGSPLQVDLGLVQAAGRIVPGVVNLNAQARVGMGISYHF
jgi:hypothetical protein